MKIIVEYEIDNTDGYYDAPAEVAYEIIVEALTKNEPIHGFKNVQISLKETD